MKTTIEMTSKIQPDWRATITVETIKNGFAPEYSEAVKTVYMGDGLDLVVENIRNAQPEPVHMQVWSWIGQMHFRDWEISSKRTED